MPDNREQRVNQIIARFLDAERTGNAPKPEELLREHGDLTDELRSFFADRKHFQKMAAPIRPPDPADTPTLTPRTDASFSGEPEATARPAPTVAFGSPLNDRSGVGGEGVRVFGDYELLNEIARGGMGVVYKARQVSLKRIVALKMILAGQLASKGDVKRFYAEARTAANLQHPNIVAIHDVGQHDGQHFFSMDFVDGMSLAQLVRENPLPPKEAARIVHTVAEAIHYAHKQGVLHRDLKPGNVLLSFSGEPQATAGAPTHAVASGSPLNVNQAVPKVTDFGLAKNIAPDAEGLTTTGAVVGTPSYMPPEQASGQRGKLGPASDVYSLGAILYELVSGRPPFRAATPLDTLLQVLEADPASPRSLNPAVSRDLETIILKCLAKEPKKRYATAQALADDLQAFLDGRHIKARRPSLAERGLRWLRGQGRTVKISLVAAGLLAAALFGLNRYLDSRLGRILITSTGPPLSAEILAEDRDDVVGPRFTVPTQEPIALAAGNYRLRLVGPDRPSEVFHFRVEPGDKIQDGFGNMVAQKFNLELKSRALGEPIKVPEHFELVDLSPAGARGEGERRRARHDIVAVTKRGLARLDGVTGEAVWDVSMADQPALKGTLFSSAAVFGHPRFDMPEPHHALPVGDIDGDGVSDFIWCSRATSSLLAVSGKEGKALWWSYPMPGLPPGADQSKITFAGFGAAFLPSGAVAGLPVVHQPPQSPRLGWLLAGSPIGLGPLQAAVAVTAQEQADGPLLLVTMRATKNNANIVGLKPNQNQWVAIEAAQWIEAIHLGTGQTRWRHVLNPKWFGENIPWTLHQAQLVKLDGKLTLLCLAGASHLKQGPPWGELHMHLVGLDPDTGKELWPPIPIEGPAVWHRFADMDGDGKPELLILSRTSGQHGREESLLRVLSLPSGKELWRAAVPEKWLPSQDPTMSVEDVGSWMQMSLPWEQNGSEWPLLISPGREGAKAGVIVPHGWHNTTHGNEGGGEKIVLLDGATGKERWIAPPLPAELYGNSVKARRFIVGPDLDGDGLPEVFRVLWVNGENRRRARKYADHELMVDALSGADGRRLLLWRHKTPPLQTFGHENAGLRPLRWLPVGPDGGPALLISGKFVEGNVALGKTFLVAAASGKLLQEIPGIDVWLPNRSSPPGGYDMDGDGLPDLIGWRADGMTYTQRDGYRVKGARLNVLRMYSPEPWRRVGNWQASADFDGDGIDDLLDARPGLMTAVSGADGRLLWRSREKWQTPEVDQWPPPAMLSPALPCPDIDDDGIPDLLVFRRYNSHGDDKALCALSGKTGALLWSADDLKKNEQSIHRYHLLACRTLDPKLGPEVLFLFRSNPDRAAHVAGEKIFVETFDRDRKETTRDPGFRMAVLSLRDGKIRWHKRFWSTPLALSLPCLGDLNGDGVRDVVIPCLRSGYVDLLTFDGRTGQPLWTSQGQVPAGRVVPEAVPDRPFLLMADLNGDGRDDIMMKTLARPAQPGHQGAEVVQALNGADGKTLWSWPLKPPRDDRDFWNVGQPLILRRGAGPVVAVSIYDVQLQVKHDPRGGMIDTEQGHFVVFLDGFGREISRRLIRKKAADPSRLSSIAVPIWSADVDGDGQDEMLVFDRGKLLAIEPDGKTLWESAVLGAECWLHSSSLAPRGNRPANDHVHDDPRREGPSRSEGPTIVVQTRDTVFGVSGKSGKVVWRCDGPGEHVQILGEGLALPRLLWHVNKEPNPGQNVKHFQFVSCRQALPTTADGDYVLPLAIKARSYEEVELIDTRRLPWVDESLYARHESYYGANYYEWQWYGLAAFGFVVLILGLTHGRRGMLTPLLIALAFTAIYAGFLWFGRERLQPSERYVWAGWYSVFYAPAAVAGLLTIAPLLLFGLISMVVRWLSGWSLPAEQLRQKRRLPWWIVLTTYMFTCVSFLGMSIFLGGGMSMVLVMSMLIGGFLVVLTLAFRWRRRRR